MILETHGGSGKLFARCYANVSEGVVFEMNSTKSAVLAEQRPTWAVYEADCEKAMAAGIGNHLPINFVDFDPYGSPWEAIDAFLSGIKPVVNRLVFVVNDGLRNRLKMQVAWNTKSLESVVERIGNAAVYENYLEICRDLIKEKAAQAGYRLHRWTGYYCYSADRRPAHQIGNAPGDSVTHYAAVLDRIGKCAA